MAPEDEQLEELARSLADIAADVDEGDAEAPGESIDDIDVREILSAINFDQGGGDVPAPTGADASASVEQGEPENYRQANARKAREARAAKRARGAAEMASVAVVSSSSQAPQLSSGSVGGVGSTALAVYVPTDILSAVKSDAFGPFSAPHLQAALSGAARYMAARLGKTRDPDVATLATMFLDEYEGKVETKAALVDRLRVDGAKVDKVMPLMTSALVTLEQVARRRLEVLSTRAFLDPLVYVDACRYDETAMRAVSAHVSHLVAQPALEGREGSRLPQVRRVVIGTDLGPHKFFQTECTFAMLARARATLDGAGDSEAFVALKGSTATFVQSVQSNTAENYKIALGRVARPAPETMEFKLPVRLATSDSHPSNLKAERDMARVRGGAVGHLFFPCDMHIAAGCHTKVAALVKDDVSSLLAVSLSLCLAGSMRQFRKCVVEDVKERLVFLHGRPPHSAAKYKEHVMDLFMSRGPDVRLRRSLAQLYLPGDWRNDAEIEYFYQSPGSDDVIDETHLRAVIARGVARAIANRSLTTYPRHRWLGFDLSIDEIGLLEVTHGILGTAIAVSVVSFYLGVAFWRWRPRPREWRRWRPSDRRRRGRN